MKFKVCLEIILILIKGYIICVFFANNEFRNKSYIFNNNNNDNNNNNNNNKNVHCGTDIDGHQVY